MYRALQHGASFKKLAEEIFNDPALKNSGGLLGYFTVDEMEPAFENAAFALKTGQVSEPVKTKDGYSIIKIEDRQTKPLLPENDYNKHRSKLENFLEERQLKQKTSQFTDSLKNERGIVFNGPYLQKMFSILNRSAENNSISEARLSLPDNMDLPDEWVIRFKHGEWDLKELKQFARFTSQKQRGWIRTEENLKDFISGLAVRSVILRQAKNEGFQYTQEYKYNVAENFNHYLLERIEKKLFFGIEIPIDSLYIYYNEAPERFASPAIINLREIVLNTKSSAAKITAKLNEGQSFKILARKYSIRETTSKNDGEIGFLTPKDLGRWSDTAFSLKKDEWTGPLEIDSLFVFVQCIEKIPEQIRPFEEVKDDVNMVVKSYKWHELRSGKISQFKKNVSIKSYPGKLMSLKLN